MDENKSWIQGFTATTWLYGNSAQGDRTAVLAS